MKKLVPVWPWPMPAKLVEQLDAIPDINPVEALPGGPGPVLALRKAPPFACDAIVVSTPERVTEAVNIIIGDGIDLVTVRDWLSTTMKTEQPIPETQESTVRFE